VNSGGSADDDDPGKPDVDDESAGDTLSWRELLAETTDRLEGNRQHARWLLEDLSGFDAEEWVEGLDEPVSTRAVAKLDAMLARLADGEPLQYVLGHWGFRRLDLMVDRRVLIPRPETELLVEFALERLASMPSPWTVGDLGTGSGAIALALADELPLGSATIWATDVSSDALDVARANLAGLGRAATAVRLAQGSWWSALDPNLLGSFDVVVSNPPYIDIDDPEVEEIVRRWEPATALFSGDDGAQALGVLVSGAPHWLRPGGSLLCEIGSGQGAIAHELAKRAGLSGVEVRQDLAGRDRVLIAHRAG
jgi:release factor glutamine methyltransferase